MFLLSHKVEMMEKGVFGEFNIEWFIAESGKEDKKMRRDF